MKIIIISLLFFTCSSIQAQLTPKQQNQIDSLKTVISTTRSDTTKISALKAWDDIIYISDPELDMEINKQIIEICENNLKKNLSAIEIETFNKGVMHAFTNIGLINKDKSNFKQALVYLHKALKIAQELKINKDIGMCFNNIGSCYQNKGDLTKALEYFIKCLKINEGIGDKESLSVAYSNIGMIYKVQKKDKEAMDYFQKGLVIAEEINYYEGINSVNINIGGIYFNQHNYEKAFEYFQNSLILSTKLGDKKLMALCLGNIGTIYVLQKKYKKALEYLVQCAKLFEELGNKLGVAQTYDNIGEVYLKLKQYKQAIFNAKKSLSIAQEIEAQFEIKVASYLLYELYKIKNNDSEAIKMYELYVKTKDNLAKVNAIEDGIRFEENRKYLEQNLRDSIQNQNEKNVITVKHELEMDQEENKRLALYGGLFLLLVFSWMMYNRYRLIRKQSTIIEKQKDKNLFLSQKILEQDQQLILGETAKTVAHELNSPLGVIKAGAEGINYLLDEFINELLPKCTKEEQAFASRLSKSQNTDEHIGNRQKKEKSNEMTHWIKEKFDVEQELCDELAHELSELHVFKPDEEIITFLIGSQNRQAMYKMARCMGQLRSISDHTISATQRSADVISSVREALDFQESTETIDINLKDSISSVLTIIESNIKEKGSCSLEIDPDITLRSVNEFKNFQLWYNSLSLIVETSKKPMELVVSSKVDEKKIQLIISIDQDISIMNIDEHHYKIIMEAKKNSSELRLGIVKYLLSENQINLKVDKSSQQTTFVFDFPSQNP